MSTLIYDYNTIYTPSKEQRIALVDLITQNYKNWDKDSEARRKQSEKIERSLYVDITCNDRSDSENILLPEVYEQYHTLLANLIKSNFQNEDMIFNVSGEDEISEQNTPLQKANLKRIMRKMGFIKVAHEVTHHFLTKGEGISFTYWETKIEQSRRKVPVVKDIIDPITGAVLGQQNTTELKLVPKIVYDGVRVKAINPLHFVSDKNDPDFDSKQKITYSLLHPYEIISNVDYSLLTSDDKKELEKLFKEEEELTLDKDNMEANGDIVGNQAVVLDCWGDIKLEDGTVLKNYHAVVIAGKFLAQLEPNPGLRNPFSIVKWMPDPISDRGRSPLLVAIPLNQVSSIILNGQLQALRLALNPPLLCPKDFFTQDYIKLKPGLVVEYDDNLNGARQPQPYTFETIPTGNDFLRLMQDKIESSTGAFKYMIGSQDNRSRTATETSATVTGQNTRLSFMITLFNEEWTIPTITNIAELDANTEFEDSSINLGNTNGTPEFGKITPEVRQGSYQYTYGDSQSVVEAEAKMQKLIAQLAQFAGKADINWNSLLKIMFRTLNIKEGDEIVPPDPIDMAIRGLLGNRQVPSQTIQQLKEQFVQSGMFQQVVQQMIGGGNGNPEQSGNGMESQNVGTPQQPNMERTTRALPPTGF